MSLTHTHCVTETQEKRRTEKKREIDTRCVPPITLPEDSVAAAADSRDRACVTSRAKRRPVSGKTGEKESVTHCSSENRGRCRRRHVSRQKGGTGGHKAAELMRLTGDERRSNDRYLLVSRENENPKPSNEGNSGRGDVPWTHPTSSCLKTRFALRLSLRSPCFLVCVCVCEREAAVKGITDRVIDTGAK